MPSMMRVLRSRLRTSTRIWILRRQGRDVDPVVLRRNRVYILPTRLGVAYAAMLFSMLLGGMNYNNNLGLALTFLLAGLGLVAMHHCHGTLSGLRLRLAAAEPGFVGDAVRFRWLLENDAAVPRPSLLLEIEDPAPGQARVIRRAATAEAPARGTTEATISLPATRRGKVSLDRFVVSTSHPLGLFRAWAVLHPSHAAIAWPAPAGRDRPHPVVATDTGGAQSQASGDEDFAGLRPFQQGDSLHRVAWKNYARGQGLHTKQYAGTDVVSHVFDWDSLPDLATEDRLAQLCRWVVDAHDAGEAFGLRLPGTEIETNLGIAHRDRCLNALALFDAASVRHA